MDALFAILSGQTSASGTGQSAGQPAAAGGFDALLTSFTQASGPVQPVAPVTYRQGQNADATLFDLPLTAQQDAATGSVLAALNSATASPSPSSTTGDIAAASIGTSSVNATAEPVVMPATTVTPDGQSADMAAPQGQGQALAGHPTAGVPDAGGAAQAANTSTPSANPALAAAIQPAQAEGSTHSSIEGLNSASGSSLAFLPAKPGPTHGIIQSGGAAPAQSGLSSSEASIQSGVQTISSKAVTGDPSSATADRALATMPPTSGADGKPDASGNPVLTKAAGIVAAAPSASAPQVTGEQTLPAQSANQNSAPVTPATTTAQTAAAVPPTAEIAAAMTPDAGVQARRAANVGVFEPLTRTTQGAKSAATPPPATPAAHAPANPAVPATPQGPSVQLTPPEQVVDALTGKSSFDKAGQTPIHIETPPPAPEAEGEAVELSQARSAETSRAAERPGTAAGTARFTPANAGTLAAQIASRFHNGERRFEIRMDPPELGRVEVKMHVSHDNRVHAVLSADRPETLQDMRQHIRELERALAEAGLDLSEDGLSFELSQDRGENDGNSSSPNRFSELAFAEDAAGDVIAAALPRELYGFQLARSSSVDVRL